VRGVPSVFSVGATQLSVADPVLGGATGVEDGAGVVGVVMGVVAAVESAPFEPPAQAAIQKTAMSNVAHRAAAAACLKISNMRNYR